MLAFQWFLIGNSLIDYLEYQYWRNDIYPNTGILNIFPNIGKQYHCLGKHWYTSLIFPTLEILIKNPKLENNTTNWKNIGVLISFFHPWGFQ